jgi:acetyltransferase-like isoleucine patch superfamily enzyme
MNKIEYILCKILHLFLKAVFIVFGGNKINFLIATVWYKMESIRYRNRGVEFGEKTVIYNCLFSSSSAGDRFFVGKNCTLTGSTFLGHDASATLFLPELNVLSSPWLPGARKSIRKPIYIGDNVFIGVGCIVLPGIKIGNNVVVGAGSVVTKNIPNNVVVAGNPAKFICTIDAYIENCRDSLFKENE